MKRKTFERYLGVLSVSIAAMTFVAACSLIEFFVNPKSEIPVSSFEKDISITVIIDPGHGGEDGGAVGNDIGLIEKEVNLSIAKELSAIFGFVEIPVELTRKDDILLFSESEMSGRKLSDLRNRVSIAESFDNPVFISIHQNKFPLEKYYGLQVYYSKNNDDSLFLAETIQNKAKCYVQKENNRQVKAAGRNIFVLNNLDCPAVLVECGFLSNNEDAKLLSDDEYQKLLAFSIYCGVTEGMENKVS
jgi:N-acetylmuramoyl-L-alanine amidase